jgi:hypothetical protein
MPCQEPDETNFTFGHLVDLVVVVVEARQGGGLAGTLHLAEASQGEVRKNGTAYPAGFIAIGGLSSPVNWPGLRLLTGVEALEVVEALSTPANGTCW